MVGPHMVYSSLHVPSGGCLTFHTGHNWRQNSPFKTHQNLKAEKEEELDDTKSADQDGEE